MPKSAAFWNKKTATPTFVSRINRSSTHSLLSNDYLVICECDDSRGGELSMFIPAVENVHMVSVKNSISHLSTGDSPDKYNIIVVLRINIRNVRMI